MSSEDQFRLILAHPGDDLFTLVRVAPSVRPTVEERIRKLYSGGIK